ncbi:hypothetical protein Acr_10g0003660 [Actinidia rufa]|uniref:Uncharacterized protein n=1 Tax=Actinidia rufa TaxID=165716 RepID=A0A7J0F8L0_9ERIC|nr:hypothetical protein Acr_10g0003660 [Actinidia rufa]
MESAIEDWPNNYVSPLAVKFPPISPTDLYYKGRKRIRSPSEERLHSSVAASAYTRDEPEQKRKQELTRKLMREALKVKQPATPSGGHDVIELDDDGDENDVPAGRLTVVQPVNLPERPVVVIDSDDEEPGNQRSFVPPYQQIVLSKPVGEFLMKDFLVREDKFKSELPQLTDGLMNCELDRTIPIVDCQRFWNGFIRKRPTPMATSSTLVPQIRSQISSFIR